VLSPGSCSRCNCALPDGSVAVLCPACRTAGETSRPQPGTPEQSPAHVEPVTQSYHPSDPEAVGTATDPFADAVERATLTAAPVVPVRSHTAAPHSITLTGPEAPEVARLPLAPPGYELVRRLGGGGMGDVFLAREFASARDVAMKFLRSPGSATGVERFLAEVRALARIDHPNIVKFLATDFYREQPFFTMEFVSGGNLAERVSTAGPPPPLEAARLIASAARAVHAAHLDQVLHRDLKPSNVLLTADGNVKVSDFGLAKLTDLDESITGDEPLGTPGFMPPEQIARNRGPVGAGSDVYGLGATLYYLLTGRAPFVGENKLEIVAQVERDQPDRPRALRPEVPAALEAIALKCLEKDPAARYSSAAELADDLDRFLAGMSTRALPLTRMRRARRWLSRNRVAIGLAGAGVLLAVALVAAGRQLQPPLDAEQRIRDEIAAGKVVRLLQPDGQPRSPSWPLGSIEVRSSEEDGGTCHFESPDIAVLLLLQDPGVDSYRVRAELRQSKKAGHVVPDVNPDTSQVGLILGYAGQNGPNGTRAHTMTALAFREFDHPAKLSDVRMLEVVEAGYWSGVGFVPPELRTVRKSMSVPLRPADGPDPPWRELDVRVTQDGIWVPDAKGNPQLVSSQGIVERWNYLEDLLGARLGGLNGPIADWSPRKPIGIWVRGSTVSVRNVIIESSR
jgi:hypothetical protein